MEIDHHVNGIVQSIIDQLTAQVQQQAAQAIQNTINEVVASIDSTTLLSDLLSQKLDNTIAQLHINKASIESAILDKVSTITDTLSATVQSQAVSIATQAINAQVGQFDFPALCQATLVSAISNQNLQFPPASIPTTALDLTNFKMSGNGIEGGIIKQFGSTGIDDKASSCQLTIMDSVTVVENNLLTRDLTVKGTTTIEGDLNVTGTVVETSPMYVSLVNSVTNNVRTSLDQVVFASYADMVTNQIRTNGLDLSRVTMAGRDIINGDAIGNFITQSNLQKVGQLTELQVQGEAFLSGTLYSTNQRVGINTIEPSSALTVWDQEVEVTVGKQISNTGVIETPRNQALVLSSNGKNNVTLTPDGATTINKLNMGTMSFSAADAPPMDNQPRGTVIFNSNPNLGGPLGWVSLGNATWANFGIID